MLRFNYTLPVGCSYLPDVAVLRFSDAIISVDSLRDEWTEIFKINFNSKVNRTGLYLGHC